MLLDKDAVIRTCQGCCGDIVQEPSSGRWASVAYPITDPYGCVSGDHAPAEDGGAASSTTRKGR